MNRKLKNKTTLHGPTFSLRHRLERALWILVYTFFFRISPTPMFAVRNKLLRLFGARIAVGVKVYPSVQVWYPKNLVMERGASIGPRANIYNQGCIEIGENAIVSQGVQLCASTHDYNDPVHPLVLAPITIGKNAWVCADAFVCPGVNVAEGSVIGARAVASRHTEPWHVYAGNPAVKLKERNKF